MRLLRKTLEAKYAPLLFLPFIIIYIGALVSTSFHKTIVTPNKSFSLTPPVRFSRTPQTEKREIEDPPSCAAFNSSGTCPSNSNLAAHWRLEEDPGSSSSTTCPDYFRWIHEDLRPWAYTGIAKDMVERARETADFKLLILDGKVYVETYNKPFQTRDVFTLWGILQLLKRFPGKVPDLELMFECGDYPSIPTSSSLGPNASAPPPLFHYCSTDAAADIPFPDWSFWGWAELNIKPWEQLSKDLRAGNKRKVWMEREPYAYWKGNPKVSLATPRLDLMRCNATAQQDWGSRLYSIDWRREVKAKFPNSDLASQCIHRYKIYVEGNTWSVSEKYILACDSPTLIIKPEYYDFFTRSLMPMHHYWPIDKADMCRSIKFAVEWGNTHTQEVQAIGKRASRFMQEELKMDNVYCYMLHLLREYARLLTFKPTKSENAEELCEEALLCSAQGPEKNFMLQSRVIGLGTDEPCSMPSPYDLSSLRSFLAKKESSIEKVKIMERDFWKDH